VRTSIAAGIAAQFSLVVSNPPYIPISRLQFLPKSVKYYEPLKALNGGEKGTMFTKVMIEHCTEVMTDTGFMAIEIDEEAVGDLKEFLTRFDHLRHCFEKDLFGRNRYLFLEKTG
jgi:release factor glutamine methyltransferase